MEEINKEFQLLKDSKEELSKQIEAFIKKAFTRFWELNPAVKAVFWHQYAPSFNDGDPCYFSVHAPFFTNIESKEKLELIDGDDFEEELEEEGFWCEYSFGGEYCPSTPEGVNESSVSELSQIICSRLTESTMERLFGNGSRVIATREGFQTRDYYDY